MSITENWQELKHEIHQTAALYGRQGTEIQVMAVSKTRTVQEVQEACKAGLHLFGENRVEEAAEKFAKLNEQACSLCLIGHLQSNKIRLVNTRFAAVHSVDSVKLAQKLSVHRKNLNAPLEVLVQVNTSGEESKSGFPDANKFAEAAAEIAELPFLNLKGVMTMAPFVDDEKTVRQCFARCREWAERIANLSDTSLILSMGMSSDFRWAIAEGSNLLRIGTSIFGERQ